MHTAARAPPPYCPMQRCSPHLAGSAARSVSTAVLSPLWCHPGPPHAIRVWVHTNAPGRTGFPDLDILRCASAVCARLRQSARRLLKSPMCSYTLSSPASPPPAHTACATAMYHMPHRARRLVSLLPHLYGLEGLLYGNPLQRRRAACTPTASARTRDGELLGARVFAF